MLNKELLEEIAQTSMLIEQIVDRAEKLKVLNMDKTAVISIFCMILRKCLSISIRKRVVLTIGFCRDFQKGVYTNGEQKRFA